MANPTPSPRATRGVQVTAGILFILTGLLKLLMPAPGPGWHAGGRGFGEVLAMLGVPFPAFFGYAVPGLEVLGGLSLITNRGSRYAAALLAIDMLMAIKLVGGPGARGQALKVGQHSIGTEPWRLPLEVILLLAMLWLALDASRKKM